MCETKTCKALNTQTLLLLGACPALAVTTSLQSGLLMGLAVLAVLVLTSLTVSLLKNLISEVKLSACVLISAGFTVMVKLLLEAYLPELYYANGDLALYLSVLTVSPLVYLYAEKATASAPGKAVVKSLLGGVFFLLLLVVVSALREVLGSATIFGKELAFMADYTIAPSAHAFMGYVVLAIAAAVLNVTSCKEGE